MIGNTPYDMTVIQGIRAGHPAPAARVFSRYQLRSLRQGTLGH